MPILSKTNTNAGGVNVPSSGISADNLKYFDVGGAIIGRDVGITIQGKGATNRAFSRLKPWEEVVGIVVNENIEKTLKEGYTQESKGTFVKSIGDGQYDVRKINPATGEVTSAVRTVYNPEANMAPSEFKAWKTVDKLTKAYNEALSKGDTAKAESLSRGINAYTDYATSISGGKVMSSTPSVVEADYQSSTIDRSKFSEMSNMKSSAFNNNIPTIRKEHFSNTFYAKANSPMSSMINTPIKTSRGEKISGFLKSSVSPIKSTLSGVAPTNIFKTKNISTGGNVSVPRHNPTNWGFSSNNPLLNVTSNSTVNQPSSASKLTMGFSSINPFLNTTGNSGFSNIIKSDIGKNRQVLNVKDKLKMMGVK